MYCAFLDQNDTQNRQKIIEKKSCALSKNADFSLYFDPVFITAIKMIVQKKIQGATPKKVHLRYLLCFFGQN